MKLLSFIVVMIFVFGQVAAQDRAVVQDEEAQAAWREDVDYLLDRLVTMHREPYYRFTQAELEATASNLKEEIPYLTDQEITFGLLRLTSMLDGHTFIDIFQEGMDTHLYPLRLYIFEEGIYVVKAAPAYEYLVEQRVVSIGGKDIQEVYQALMPYQTTDNDQTFNLMIPRFMVTPEALQAADVIETLDMPQFVFEDADGVQQTVDFAPVTVDEFLAWNEGEAVWQIVGLPPQQEPLYLSNRSENFWLTYLSDSQTLYIQYNGVQGRTESGKTMSRFISDIEAAIEENEIARVVVDIRHNPGGEMPTFVPLVEAIHQSALMNEPGKLFIIMGRRTFSAAVHFTVEVLKETDAILVGEPTGGSPNGYGNPRVATLPNSRIQVWVATVINASGEPGEIRTSLEPDIYIPSTAADYFNGVDAALEAILAMDES